MLWIFETKQVYVGDGKEKLKFDLKKGNFSIALLTVRNFVVADRRSSNRYGHLCVH